uniref:Uncharacterized protein n=1 Tax=Populus trichocarpa TaxID=3694 RepID=A0A3N7FNR7_POPTR
MDDDYSWTQNLKGVSVYVRVIDGKCLMPYPNGLPPVACNQETGAYPNGIAESWLGMVLKKVETRTVIGIDQQQKETPTFVPV